MNARRRKTGNEKTSAEQRVDECVLHKPLQGSVEEQNNIIHSGVARRREQDRLRKAAKRAEGKIIREDSLLSKAGIEQAVRDNFLATYPDPKMAKHLHKFFRFVHVVLDEHQRKQATNDEMLGISKYILAAHTGHDAPISYLKVREHLQRWGIIEVDGYYSRPLRNKKGKARSYRIGPAFRDAHQVFTKVHQARTKPVANQVLRQSLVKLQQITDHHGQPQFDPLVIHEDAPHLQWLLRNVGRLSIDQDAAFKRVDEMVASAYPLRMKRAKDKSGHVKVYNRTMTPEIGQLYKESVMMLNHQQQAGKVEARFSVTNGRLNTAFTRLFTNGRDYTMVDGQRMKLVSIDLGCSQPYLLNHRLRQSPAGQLHLDELDQMQHKMLSGFYYEEVLAACKEEDPELDTPAGEAKTELFRNLQYSKRHRNTPYRRAFNKRFPGYHKALMDLVTLGSHTVEKTLQSGQKVLREEKVYRNLAIELQRVESELFLNVITPRLYREMGPESFILTVHDSFYCLPEHAETVARVMREELLAHTGYEPTIKVDGVAQSSPLTKKLATQAISAPVVMAPRTTYIHGRVRTPHGHVTAYHSYVELPDHWKRVVAETKQASAKPTVSLLPAISARYTYADFY